jgi:hypothetical protein
VEQLLQGAGGTLTIITYDAAGAPVDSGSGDGTADVLDSSGVTVLDDTAATHGSTGEYTITIPTSFTTLDRYDVVWTLPNGQTRRSEFELVGGFVFTIAELRAFDPDLADAARFPATAIVDAREVVETVFEHPRVTNLSFRPRGRRERLDGTGTDRLLLSAHEVAALTSVSIDQTAMTSEELADVAVHPWGLLVLGGGIWTPGNRNVEVLYTHGLDTTPADVRRAAMRLARHVLVRSAIEPVDRANFISTELGNYRLTMAGRDGPTGLPEVDAVLAAYSRVTPGSFA